MIFLSRLLNYFSAPEGTNPEEEETGKTYGWVQYDHLKPYSISVEEIGIFDPDILLLALKRFLEESPGIVNEIRISTYPHKEVNSQYLMIQDAGTTEPDRWFCVSPIQWVES